jgi:hypothetical protein
MMIDANGAEKQAEKLLDKLPDELMIAKIWRYYCENLWRVYIHFSSGNLALRPFCGERIVSKCRGPETPGSIGPAGTQIKSRSKNWHACIMGRFCHWTILQRHDWKIENIPSRKQIFFLPRRDVSTSTYKSLKLHQDGLLLLSARHFIKFLFFSSSIEFFPCGHLLCFDMFLHSFSFSDFHRRHLQQLFSACLAHGSPRESFESGKRVFWCQ